MRYKLVTGSQSYHCCFKYTVVDTESPYMIGDKQYKDRFNQVCECFEKEHADMICDALNGIGA